jgi:hypothetical protein
MPPLPRHKLRALPVRRLICSALALAYIVTAAGVPLPLTARPAKTGEAYPCAGGACGCRSAQQCWRSCCCHTLAERLDWARQHGVRPPDDAIAAAVRSGLDVAWLQNPLKSKNLCAKTCCASKANSTARCCQTVASKKQPKTSKGGGCAHCATTPAAPSDNNGDNQFVVWRAMKCHGNSLNWLAAGPVLIDIRPSIAHQLPLTSWLGATASDSAFGSSLDPAVPPPEQA